MYRSEHGVSLNRDVSTLELETVTLDTHVCEELVRIQWMQHGMWTQSMMEK